MKLVYLAGKFTAPSAWKHKQNVWAAEWASADVAQLGAMPVVPQKNTENLEGLCTPEFWYEGTLELMRRCDAVYLFNRHDYEISKGVKSEIEEAKRLKIPFFIALDDLSDWLAGKPTFVDENGLHHTTNPTAEVRENPAYKFLTKALEAGER